MATPPSGKPGLKKAKPLLQARPMMAHPEVPTRLVVSGGRRVAPITVLATKRPGLLARLLRRDG
jgi:hypothetical protein